MLKRLFLFEDVPGRTSAGSPPPPPSRRGSGVSRVGSFHWVRVHDEEGGTELEVARLTASGWMLAGSNEPFGGRLDVLDEVVPPAGG